jgi:hypothetical protein
MVNWSSTCLILALVAVTVSAALPESLSRLSASITADPSDISISGVSSGALAAVQYQVAYSKTTRGVGVLAGGPYYVTRVCLRHSVPHHSSLIQLID